jgi:hypothetical protein
MTFAQVGTLFAQQGGFNNAGAGGGANGGDAAAAGLIFLCYGLVFILSIVVTIFFLLAMSRALQSCSPENRTMEPGQVWLSFIPLVGIVFFIMAMFKVPDSLSNEYRDRGLRGNDDEFGKTMAIWYIVSAFVCGIISPIFLIIYWVKIAGYTKTLNERSGRREEEEDDRPSRRRRREEEDDRDEDDDRPSRRRRDNDE